MPKLFFSMGKEWKFHEHRLLKQSAGENHEVPAEPTQRADMPTQQNQRPIEVRNNNIQQLTQIIAKIPPTDLHNILTEVLKKLTAQPFAPCVTARIGSSIGVSISSLQAPAAAPPPVLVSTPAPSLDPEQTRRNAVLAGYMRQLQNIEYAIKNIDCTLAERGRMAMCNWGGLVHSGNVRASLQTITRPRMLNDLKQQRYRLEEKIHGLNPSYVTAAQQSNDLASARENITVLPAGHVIKKLIPDGSGNVRYLKLNMDTGWHDAWSEKSPTNPTGKMLTLEELQNKPLNYTNGTWTIIDGLPTRNPQLAWKDRRDAEELRVAQERERQKPLKQAGFVPIDSALYGAPAGTFSDVDNMAEHLGNSIGNIAFAGLPQPRYVPPEHRQSQVRGASLPSDLPRVGGFQPRSQGESNRMQADIASYQRNENEAGERTAKNRNRLTQDYEKSKWLPMDSHHISSYTLDQNYIIAFNKTTGKNQVFSISYLNSDGARVWRMDAIKELNQKCGIRIDVNPQESLSYRKADEVVIRAAKGVPWGLSPKSVAPTQSFTPTSLKAYHQIDHLYKNFVLGFEQTKDDLIMRVQVPTTQRRYEVHISNDQQTNLEKSINEKSTLIQSIEKKLISTMNNLNNREKESKFPFSWKTDGPVVISDDRANFTLQRQGIYRGQDVKQYYSIVTDTSQLDNFSAAVDSCINKDNKKRHRR